MKKTFLSVIAFAVVAVLGVGSLAAAFNVSTANAVFDVNSLFNNNPALHARPLSDVLLCVRLRSETEQRMRELKLKGLSMQLSREDILENMREYMAYVRRSCAGLPPAR